MKNKGYHFWFTRLLLSIILYILVTFMLQRCAYFINYISLIFTAKESHQIISYSLLSLGNLILITVHSLLIYALLTIIFLRPKRSPAFVEDYKEIPELEALFHSKAGYRNLYLVLTAILFVLYSIYSQPSINSQLALCLVLLVYFYLIRWQEKPNSGIPTFVVLFICLIISTFRLSNLHLYEILTFSSPFFVAVLLSLLFTSAWVILQVRYKPSSSSKEWYVILIVVSSVFFIPYFQSLLTVINCQYAPKQPHQKIVYEATVHDICPPAGNSYTLALTYMQQGRQRGVLLPVQRQVYHNATIGDKINIHLYSGLFGWSWFQHYSHLQP